MDSITHTTGPGFMTQLVQCFLSSFRIINSILEFERSLAMLCRGRNSRSGLAKDIEIGRCVIQCDVPHQWIAQRQVGSCDRVGCHVHCLRYGLPVWQHIGQSITATSRHRRDMTSDVSK